MKLENRQWLEVFWKAYVRKCKFPWTDFSRNLDFLDAHGGVSKESEEHVLEPGEEKSFLHNDRNLVISISYVKRKKKYKWWTLASIAKEISIKSVEGATWFIPVIYKTWERRAITWGKNKTGPNDFEKSAFPDGKRYKYKGIHCWEIML